VKKLLLSLLSFSVLVLGLTLIKSYPAHAAEVDRGCKNVEAIFARGSGSKIGENNGDAITFFQALQKRLTNSNLSFDNYELGKEHYGGYMYPAVAVDNWSFSNAIGAYFSAGGTSGGFTTYGVSVLGGINELKSYLTQRYEKCKAVGTWYVLGGHSQGAQVIGQALPDIGKEIRDRIAYVGLFGDPKLHFPEGSGGPVSDACRGKNISKWRRGVMANCMLESGILQARKPYLPEDMTEKTGLWCYFKDMFCDPSFFPDTEGHNQYKDAGRAIDEAAQEAAAKLRLIFAEAQSADKIDVSLSHGAKTAGEDTVFVIDTSVSMSDITDRVKSSVLSLANETVNRGGRVALVAYRDLGDNYTAKVFSGFNDSYSNFQLNLRNLVPEGGGDYPEAALHALTVALNELDWKNGAVKSAVLFTDSTFHNPDRVDGSTIRTVAKRSLEIDPVNIFPVVPENLTENYRELASETSGQVIPVSNYYSTEVLASALSKIQERPVALLKSANYRAVPGQEVTLDASDSYVIGGTITKYEWDLNGDNIFDTTTTTPVFTGESSTSFTFDGIVQLRVTASNGLTANTTAKITFAPAPPGPPPAPTNLSNTIDSTKDNQSTVTVRWNGDQSLIDVWAIRINDIPVGYITKDRTSLQITDIDRTNDVVIGVAGYKTGSGFSETKNTTVLSITNSPEPPILSPCMQSNFILQLLCKTIALAKTVINGVVYYILPWKI